jgi:hypothetical protein
MTSTPVRAVRLHCRPARRAEPYPTDRARAMLRWCTRWWRSLRRQPARRRPAARRCHGRGGRGTRRTSIAVRAGCTSATAEFHRADRPPPAGRPPALLTAPAALSALTKRSQTPTRHRTRRPGRRPYLRTSRRPQPYPSTSSRPTHPGTAPARPRPAGVARFVLDVAPTPAGGAAQGWSSHLHGSPRLLHLVLRLGRRGESGGHRVR